MTITRTLVLAFFLPLAGCSMPPAVAPLGDSGPLVGDGGPPEVDAGTDATALVDGATMPDTGVDGGVEAPDAWSPPLDAGADSAPGEYVAFGAACDRVQAAYAATGCSPDFYWCLWAPPRDTGMLPVEYNVHACECSIAAGFAASGCAGARDAEARCASAAGGC